MFVTAVLILPCLLLGNPIRRINPGRYTGNSLPALNRLSRINGSPANTSLPADLDIVADYLALSDSRVYAGIQTRGGGFSTSGNLGTAYYSYMAVIANPASEDVVWALTYINVPLAGIRPGLYRVEGWGRNDLIRLGDIRYKLDKSTGSIVMSCELSDLLADPAFSAWYKRNNPSFGFASQTNRSRAVPYRTIKQDSTYPGSLIVPNP